jgi:hypothetical protein
LHQNYQKTAKQNLLLLQRMSRTCIGASNCTDIVARKAYRAKRGHALWVTCAIFAQPDAFIQLTFSADFFNTRACTLREHV